MRLAGLLRASLLFVGLASLAGPFARASWTLELLTHFRVQYAVALLAGAGILAWLRSPRSAIAYALLGAWSAAPVIALHLPAEGPPATSRPAGPVLTALLLNVHTANVEHERVLELIATEDADLVVLQEVNQRWAEVLASTIEAYPHRVVHPREDNFGILLMSKLPMERSETPRFDATRVPSILGVFDVAGVILNVLATHPVPPASSRNASFRNEHLLALGSYAAQPDGAVLVLGDLNSTPWSPYFSDLLRSSGLRNAARGFGVLPSWPALPWLLRLPLDHCLHSEEIEILDLGLGDAVGSDHRPVVVALQVTATGAGSRPFEPGR